MLGDTHIPFERKDYLDFCVQIKRKYKCQKVVHIGDLVDNHAINYHEHDPDGRSPKDEFDKAKERIKKWIKAFPEVLICRGNHDDLVSRKGRTYGFPSLVFKEFNEIWGLPKSWVLKWNHTINGIRFEHGTGYSGLYPQAQASKNNRQNTVIGHCHSVAGVIYSANDISLIYGMSVGCGIDRKQYAFWYGKDFKNKPILGCGVTIDGIPKFEPMKL